MVKSKKKESALEEHTIRTQEELQRLDTNEKRLAYAKKQRELMSK